MQITIREILKEDKTAVLEMMRVFYASPAVYTNGSEQIFLTDIENCLTNTNYLQGFIVESSSKILGYAMIAKSFSTEFGKPCIWLEDLYVKEEFRGLGIGKTVIDFITKKYDGSLFRLEVEEENESAIKLYKKCGFTTLPYMEMKK